MKKALYILGIVLLVIALPFMQIAKETSGKRRLNTNRVGRNVSSYSIYAIAFVTSLSPFCHQRY